MATTRRPKPSLCSEELPGSKGLPRDVCSEVCPLCNPARPDSPSRELLALLETLRRLELSPAEWDAVQWHTTIGD